MNYLKHLNAARDASRGWKLTPTNTFKLSLGEKLFYGIRKNPTPRKERNYITTK